MSAAEGKRRGVPSNAAGLCLYRMAGENLIGCELVMFSAIPAGVDTVLRRAAISGHVEVHPNALRNHFADILDTNGNIIENAALDAKSYKALKTRWMRCKVLKEPTNAT